MICKHGVRSAITPIVTILGLDIGHPARRRDPHRDRLQHPRHRPARVRLDPKSDLPTIQGTVLFGAFFIIFLNLFVDIVYAFLDPRVRTDS